MVLVYCREVLLIGPEFMGYTEHVRQGEALPGDSKNLTHNPPYLGNGARQDVSYYY